MSRYQIPHIHIERYIVHFVDKISEYLYPSHRSMRESVLIICPKILKHLEIICLSQLIIFIIKFAWQTATKRNQSKPQTMKKVQWPFFSSLK